MTLSVHAMSIEVFVAMLGDLSKILDKAAEHAKAEGIDPTTLVQARLAPDMFDLATQVRIACDQAKFGAARLAGQDAPVFADDEATLDELKTRIAKTIAYVSGFDARSLEGSEKREVIVPTPREFYFEMTGLQFLRDWALPNLFFHVTTAYDILRHKGVPIGKQDFLAHAAGYRRTKTAA